jgi:hypothetical protein
VCRIRRWLALGWWSHGQGVHSVGRSDNARQILDNLLIGIYSHPLCVVQRNAAPLCLNLQGRERNIAVGDACYTGHPLLRWLAADCTLYLVFSLAHTMLFGSNIRQFIASAAWQSA